MRLQLPREMMGGMRWRRSPEHGTQHAIDHRHPHEHRDDDPADPSRFIGLSVFGSRYQAKDHGLRTVERTAYPT